MKKLLGILVLVLVACLACTAFATEAEQQDEDYTIPTSKVYAYGDVSSITTLAGHTIVPGSFEWVDEQPACGQIGTMRIYCTDPQKKEPHWHHIQVQFGHFWASESGNQDWGKVIEKPTCQKEGKAQDVCTLCGATREKYRTIEKTGHAYNDKTYEVFKAPTCTEPGLGQHKCIYCGELKADEVDKDGKAVKLGKDGKPVKENEEGTYLMVVLTAEHKFTDWRIIKQGTCAAYGKAERVCLNCGEIQVLDDAHKTDFEDIVEKDKDGKVTKTTLYIDTVEGVKKVNTGWKVPDKKVYDAESGDKGYQKYVDGIKFEYEITKNWLVDCYTRQLTFACPYCEKYILDADPSNDALNVHKHFVITLKAPLTVSHEWQDEPDKALSLAPTCASAGFDVYLCKYDATKAKHGHADFTAQVAQLKADLAAEKKGVKVEDVLKLGKTWTSTDDPTVTKLDPQVKIVMKDALGHKWNEWTSTVFKKDGVEYDLWVRTCSVCGATEHYTDEKKGIEPCDEHDYEVVEEKAATCTVDGYKKCICKVCGAELEETIKAAGHKAVAEKDKVWKEATCTEAGMIEHTCEVCNEKYYEETAALGHDVVVDEAVAPTVEATGLTEGSHCARCNEVLVAQEELPKLLDGLVEMDNGEWHYYEEGEFIDDKTGIVEFEGGKFIVVNGVKSKAMGLTNCPGDVFYYLVEGQIQEVTQLAEYKGAWFAIKDGALDTSVNGLVDYDGGKFLFSDGWLRKDINGLCQVGDDWYFFANGQLQQVSQVASYDGEFFVIKDGKLDADYNGTIEYDGATFNVVAGQLYPIAE